MEPAQFGTIVGRHRVVGAASWPSLRLGEAGAAGGDAMLSGLTVVALAVLATPGAGAAGPAPFVNWEHPQVHPVDLTPDAAFLLVVNTADARLEVFSLSAHLPRAVASIPVGLDPVSVRARTAEEAWVVNHVSDSVSVVNLRTGHVLATVPTSDEPTDVVFAGAIPRAFVSCSQANRVEVFEVGSPYAQVAAIAIDAEEPRALAVSSDGRFVYAAVFESGNRTTILQEDQRRKQVVSDPAGPYSGRSPPPNDGDGFRPPLNPALPTPDSVSLIVKKHPDQRWRDDNGGDWTEFVSGSRAAQSERVPGWDLPDHDVAIIDTQTNELRYATGLMNLCMAMAVNPKTGELAVVGTDALNEVRYEPNLQGRFLRVNMATFDPASDLSTTSPQVVDLNPHLTYSVPSIPQPERDLSIGDPRAIVWEPTGQRAFIAGMGSNNVIIVDTLGRRAGKVPTLKVGEGPTGLAFDPERRRLYVLNRFEGSLSVIDADAEQELARIPFFDPTPAAIRTGRKHLYDTHRNSGLGHIACASCHVDGRIDRLCWDLGNPAGEMKPFEGNCRVGVDNEGPRQCDDWHPMKGPLLTQTLQDIVGKEPFHWRGDRRGLEEFSGAFVSLQGADEPLPAAEMQEFEDFLATITYPPNPLRNLDNSLPRNVSLEGHFAVGRFAPAGTPMPNGNAQNGLDRFRRGRLDQHLVDCVTCHTLPTGVGSNYVLDNNRFVPLPPGPDGELHHAIRPVTGAGANVSRKVAQLRNLYERVGMEGTQPTSRSGFGFFYDGSVDSLTRFLAAFSLDSLQDTADMVAFLLAFSGSDVPTGTPFTPLELPGPSSNDTHAAVGVQVTLGGTRRKDRPEEQLLEELTALADTGVVGLVAHGEWHGEPRGFLYTGGGQVRSDRAVEVLTLDELVLGAGKGSEITFTVVPSGTETRIGVDRDVDGALDGDEWDACSDPADSASLPENAVINGDSDRNGRVDLLDLASFLECLAGPGIAVPARCRCGFDLTPDGAVALNDFAGFQRAFQTP